MKTTLKLGLLSLAASAILVGCGSDTTTSNTGGEIQTGTFIDAPVEGLAYETDSGIKGVTDKAGKFRYKNGEKVRFMIGKLDLGKATPDQDGLVTPETIAQNDDALKVQILRVLQALDSDNDPNNGITIPKEVVDSLTGLTQEVSIKSVADDAQILKLDSKLAEALDEDYDDKIDVDHNQAVAHFEQSISKWQNGHKPDQDQAQQSQGHGNGQGKGGQGNAHGTQTEGGHGNGAFDITQYPVSTLTQEVKDALAYMGNEERLAYDLYMNLYNYHMDNGDEIKQMLNIATRSESKHIQIVKDLVNRYNLGADDLSNVTNPVADKDVAFDAMPSGQYDVPAVQTLYDTLYAKGTQSVKHALEVGCMVEVTDVEDLNKYIGYAEAANATDVVEAFKVLRAGSYNHYWAFDKALKNMGVTEGCAVLGSEYAKTPEEFPANNGH